MKNYARLDWQFHFQNGFSCGAETLKEHDKYHGIKARRGHPGRHFVGDESKQRARERQTWAAMKEAEYLARKELRQKTKEHDKMVRLERQREAREDREMIQRMLDALCSLGSCTITLETKGKSCRAPNKAGDEDSKKMVRMVRARYMS